MSSEFPVVGEISRTGPGARTASCTMGIESFPEVKRPGCGVNHLSSVEVKETVEIYLYTPLCLHGRLHVGYLS